MFLRSVGGVICGGGLENSVLSALGRANAGSGDGIMVGLEGGDKDVASLVQEDLMCNIRKPVEL